MKNKNYIAGIYCRTNQKDYNSITNQKNILKGYAEENGFEIGGYYLDDGYNGLDFDRPAFKQMITDIENGKINSVIIKDLSRLGRSYALTSEYTDRFFPEHNVSLISVNDGHDSLDTIREVYKWKDGYVDEKET